MSDIKMKEHTFDSLTDIEIEEVQIREAISSISATSAPGPDGIPAFLYKEYADHLIYPILRIWRLSLDTGELPEGIAVSIITPIFKGESGALQPTTDPSP